MTADTLNSKYTVNLFLIWDFWILFYLGTFQSILISLPGRDSSDMLGISTDVVVVAGVFSVSICFCLVLDANRLFIIICKIEFMLVVVSPMARGPI